MKKPILPDKSSQKNSSRLKTGKGELIKQKFSYSMTEMKTQILSREVLSLSPMMKREAQNQSILMSHKVQLNDSVPIPNFKEIKKLTDKKLKDKQKRPEHRQITNANP